MNNDDILSELIAQTSVDPALGRDILEATQWNLSEAVATLNGFNATEPSEAELHAEEVAALEQYSREHEEKKKKDGQTKSSESSKLRGMSFISPNVVNYFHKTAKMKTPQDSKVDEQLIDEDFFRHSFMLPDFSSYPEDFRRYLWQHLVETTHLVNLEKSGYLNWWAATGQCPKLTPLHTSGDGNCLLHAVSLGMWGFHDQELLLRTSLYRLFTTTDQGTGIHQRWKFQIEKRNKEAGGLIFSDEEWEVEWKEIVNTSSCQDRNEPNATKPTKSETSHSTEVASTGTEMRSLTPVASRGSIYRPSYESLEEVHVFALAHVLKRPIIVIANKVLKGISGEDLAPIYFSGIYLPLEYHPRDCYKSPMVLAYDSAHFSPLLSEEKKGGSKYSRCSNRTDVIIPLVTPDGKLLPVQFMTDPKKASEAEDDRLNREMQEGRFPDDVIRLLETYLMIRWIQLDSSGIKEPHCASDDVIEWALPKERFAAAKITYETQPAYQRELVSNYIDHARKKYDEQKQNPNTETGVLSDQMAQQAKINETVVSKPPNHNMQQAQEEKTKKPAKVGTPKLESKPLGSPPPLLPITSGNKPRNSDRRDGGYSRDHISGIGLDTSAGRVCRSVGCNNVASEALSGYCSKCYPKTHTIA